MPLLVCVQCKAEKLEFVARRAKCETCDLWMVPPGRIIAQNSHQSGDTYGVGMALVVEPTCELLFLTSPDDRGCMEKVAYYAGLGIEKARLGVLLLVKVNADAEMEAKALEALRAITTVYVYPVGTKDDDEDARAWEPNQLYQLLVNPGLFDRDKNNSREEAKAVLVAAYGAARLPYVTAKLRGPVAEVGASTRLVADRIQTNLAAVIEALWTAVATSALQIDDGGVARAFATTVIEGILPKKPKGVMLLWVRSLNGTERKELLDELSGQDRRLIQARRAKGRELDDLFWALSKKRNPQHLMTPQLYATLLYLGARMGYAVIPIGDEVLFDEYLSISNGIKGPVWIGRRDDNLINFWEREPWFGGPQRRIRQLFLLWHLFRDLSSLGLPLVQIGLRSGEMEKGAYLGIPTIYLEEAASETGSRMLPVTVGGLGTREEEPSEEAIAWWQRATGLRDVVSGKLLRDLKDAQAKLKEGKGTKHWQGRVTDLTQKIEDDKVKLTELRENRRKLKAQQLDAFLFAVTDHSALTNDSQGGLPFFFRLTTHNVVGLYGAGSTEAVQHVWWWLRGKFEPEHDEYECPDILLRGTLTEMEIDLLYNVLLNVRTGFGEYLARFFPKDAFSGKVSMSSLGKGSTSEIEISSVQLDKGVTFGPLLPPKTSKPSSSLSKTSSKAQLESELSFDLQMLMVLHDGLPWVMTDGGEFADGSVLRLPCLAQGQPSCGQRAVYNVLALNRVDPSAALSDDVALRAMGPLALDINADQVRALLDHNGGQSVVVIQDFAEVPVLRGLEEFEGVEPSAPLQAFLEGGPLTLHLVVNTLAPDAYSGHGGHWIAVEVMRTAMDSNAVTVTYIDSLQREHHDRLPLIRGLLDSLGLTLNTDEVD